MSIGGQFGVFFFSFAIFVRYENSPVSSCCEPPSLSLLCSNSPVLSSAWWAWWARSSSWSARGHLLVDDDVDDFLLFFLRCIGIHEFMASRVRGSVFAGIAATGTSSPFCANVFQPFLIKPLQRNFKSNQKSEFFSWPFEWFFFFFSFDIHLNTMSIKSIKY